MVDEELTRQAFDARVNSSEALDNYVTLTGPMSPGEVHDALNALMVAARKK